MTYSLNTLNASSPGKNLPRSVGARVGHELLVLAGLFACLVWLLALWSYAPQDPAWSTSGASASGVVHNRMGLAGAWLADVSYFVFGFSVWWCLAAAIGAWAASLTRLLRGGAAAEEGTSPRRPATLRILFWGGLALLLAASCALEWTRMYRFEALLPGHAGGVLG